MGEKTGAKIVTCPRCGAEIPLDGDILKSVAADYRKRIEALEAENKSQRLLGEWSKGQRLKRIKKKKESNERRF